MPEVNTSAIDFLTDRAIVLLQKLITTPSLSREEDNTANILAHYLEQQGLKVNRLMNNVWVRSSNFDVQKPTILLNSHHDTVKPASTYRRNPFAADIESGKLYGLGSNDAGGALVCLLHSFLALNELPDRSYNLIFAASAEEEISGKYGIAALLPELGNIDLAIVGEPTGMQMAVAEKGLMVIDGEAQGKSGHAARNEGINAIYIALKDIQTLKDFRFPLKSETLGEIHISVTQIQAGTQHNVVPDSCTFVVDVRTHEQYTNQQVHEILQKEVHSVLTPRSFRLNASGISMEHPVVMRGKQLGLTAYGSPTLSDQALMSGFPSLKIGPGLSERSHTADEYILTDEVREGIRIYLALLEGLTI
ncbi:acetylornithine deacetylase [Catalinimonas alkaloidigena]|uniref:M20 family metallo-hydrolase n=1 Tax=Catalinimonas alkaloidigena TaxID=1075417 RepID=UPI0024068FC9|nr:M20 family metallo-hydrolase [Catalinimonas alkaloidigena]MDF9797056.1 acetylornithine deacetylase [Catalinimonas alkaloidigena]